MFTATYQTSYSVDQTYRPERYVVTVEVTSVTGFADKHLLLQQGTTFVGVCAPVDVQTISLTPDPLTKFVRAYKISTAPLDVADRDAFIAELPAQFRRLCLAYSKLDNGSTPVIVSVSE